MIEVLIAEDHELSRVGIKSRLEATDFIKVVGCARDGEEALELCKIHKPDVVLMDVRMGTNKMDGYEATMKIKEYNEDIKVIFLTEPQNEEDYIKASYYDIHGFLPKTRTDLLASAIKLVQEGDYRIFKNEYYEAIKTKDRKIIKTTCMDEFLKTYSVEKRFKDIVELMLEDKSNDEIADEKVLSKKTVKTYVSNIYSSFGVNNRSQLLTLWANFKVDWAKLASNNN